MNNNFCRNIKKYSAFTFVELMIVVAVIGILMAVAIVSFNGFRSHSRDAKRVADIRQIQSALELYYANNKQYPSSLTAGGQLADNSTVYIEKIPSAQVPADGNCSDYDNNYFYKVSGSNNSYYKIYFCLGSDIESFKAGETVAFPGDIDTWTCGTDDWFDHRDSDKVYHTVNINNQCWMKENMNIGTRIDESWHQTDNSIIEKYCYTNRESYCDAYGGLYQWQEAVQYNQTEKAQGICPNGWHVPSNADIVALRSYVYGVTGYRCNGNGSSKPIATTSSLYWNVNTSTPCSIGYSMELNDGTGFSALGAGYTAGGVVGGGYGGLGMGTYFWSSTKLGENSSRMMDIYSYIVGISNNSNDWNFGISVRCIKD